jgi:hypothetical protein
MRFVASNVVLSRSLHKSFGSGALISGRNTLLFLDASAEGALWRVAPERLDGIGLE